MWVGLVARVPHTHLIPKGHGLVRVLCCNVRHNILQERGLLRFGEESERHRPLFRKPDYRDAIFLDVRNNLTRALRSSHKQIQLCSTGSQRVGACERCAAPTRCRC